MSLTIQNFQIDKVSNMELTQHGTDGFPFALYLRFLPYDILWTANWHWHKEIQLCIVTKGEVIFHVNEKQYRLGVGDGIYIGGTQLHTAQPLNGEDCAYICADASMKLISGWAGSTIEDRYISPFLNAAAMEVRLLKNDVPWQRGIMDRVAAISQHYKNKEFGFELEITAQLLVIWNELLHHRPDEKLYAQRNTRQKNAVVWKIMNYLKGHHGERVKLEDLSRVTSYSESECCRIFKSVTGQTIFEYLQDYRISKAVELLCDTTLSISEIAYATGFSNTSYFIKIYKKRTGKTPAHTRKELRQSAQRLSAHQNNSHKLFQPVG